jgi:hypothetical protein
MATEIAPTPPRERETLAAALRIVMARHGATASYGSLVARLGLCGAVVAAPDECIGTWHTYARNAALPLAATSLGLRLRELHPPSAAVGLQGSPEFAVHFADSYVPLIRRACDAGQCCLAWRGWPPPHELDWGVLTGVGDDQPHGISPNGAEVVLAAPAWQVYVVEDHDRQAAVRGCDAEVGAALLATRAFWQPATAASHGVLMGAPAYDALIARIGEPTPCPACGDHSAECLALLLAALADSRRTAQSWLATGTGTGGGRWAERWAEAAGNVARGLSPCGSATTVARLLKDPGARQAVVDVLTAARDVEATLFAEDGQSE